MTPHVKYFQTVLSPEQKRRAVLTALQNMALIRDLSNTLNGLATNAMATLVHINPILHDVFRSNTGALIHLNILKSGLGNITTMDLTHSSHRLSTLLAITLDSIHESGPPDEIEFARKISHLYAPNSTPPFTANVKTEPNSPAPIPIPTPSINEDLLSTYSPSLEELIEEAHRLKKFMKNTPAVIAPTIFKCPSGFDTFVNNMEQSPTYWHKILEHMLTTEGMTDTYNGRPVEYFEMGIPNSMHYIGKGKDGKFYIGCTKKNLFWRMNNS